MSKSKKNEPGLAGILLITLILGLLVLLLGPRMWFLLTVLLGATLIVGVFYLIKLGMDKKENNAFAQTTEGYVYKHLKQCQLQVDKNQEEIVEIEQNIDDLRSKIDPKLKMSDVTRKESDRILNAFYEELKLRHAKIEFYKTCLKKLQTIEYNHRMTRELIEKQKKLNQLQEDHYDDIAHMETIKNDVEYDQSYLTSIENLTLRMTGSNSIKAVENLQLELVTITKELKKLD